MQNTLNLKAVVFGGTGAVGKTLVPLLVNSPQWTKVLCIVRKQPEDWKQLKTNGKLEIQIEPDMDRLFKTTEWNLKGYDAMFVCFGSQVKHGEETFVKVDKTYPLLCADIAINNSIPHYLIVSSLGSSPNSFFLYPRTKGELQRDLKLKKLNYLSILKPGLIKNRPDQRFVEKVAQTLSFLPFPAIQCRDLALSLRGLAQTRHQEAKTAQGKIEELGNSELLEFLKDYKPKNDLV